MPRYKNILVGSDYSPDSAAAVSHAIEIARDCGARLHILHCMKTTFRYSPDQSDEDLPEDQAKDVNGAVLGDAAEKLKEHYAKEAHGLEVSWAPRVGTPYVELLRYARANGVDLIVVGRTGESKEQKHWGSTVDHLCQHAHCAVLVAKA